jgi:ribonuclease HII
MSRPPSKLSIAALRERYVHGQEPVTAQLLSKLRRDPRKGARQIHDVLARRFERERERAQRLDQMANFERVLWKSGIQRIAGVDEAGIGPLAGPVVAAAVVFPPDTIVDGVDDSKRLDAAERERLARAIRDTGAAVGVGRADVAEIDRINIYQAALRAMRRAIAALPEPPQHVLVDARTLPEIEVPQNAFNKGDGINYSIAAASIIAKTERDRLMAALHREHPAYGFHRHKGYATAAHRAAIRDHGPCAAHRMSYGVIGELCGACSPAFYQLQQKIEAAHTPEALRACEAAVAAAPGAERDRDCAGEGNDKAEGNPVSTGETLPNIGRPEGLTDAERRKLRLLLGRRWKRV